MNSKRTRGKSRAAATLPWAASARIISSEPPERWRIARTREAATTDLISIASGLATRVSGTTHRGYPCRRRRVRCRYESRRVAVEVTPFGAGNREDTRGGGCLRDISRGQT